MTSPEVRDFVEFLAKERNDSPHTVKAYARDLADFAAFCGRYYGGAWSWAGVDRLASRAWLGAQQQRGLAKRSAGRALAALRSLYRFLNPARRSDGTPVARCGNTIAGGTRCSRKPARSDGRYSSADAGPVSRRAPCSSRSSACSAR